MYDSLNIEWNGTRMMIIESKINVCKVSLMELDKLSQIGKAELNPES